MKRSLTFLLAVMLMSSPLWADYKAELERGNYSNALREIRPLAQNGDPEAQSILGTMYANGQGVPVNYMKAADWTRKAADKGFAKAQYNLGVMYDIGLGLPKDQSEAAKWYQKAAEKGIEEAQHNLGVMYEYGQGVHQDYVQAYKWFSLAAAKGDKESLRKRDALNSKMTPDQIAKAQKSASEWTPKQ